jgi:hypothetical protein
MSKYLDQYPSRSTWIKLSAWIESTGIRKLAQIRYLDPADPKCRVKCLDQYLDPNSSTWVRKYLNQSLLESSLDQYRSSAPDDLNKDAWVKN